MAIINEFAELVEITAGYLTSRPPKSGWMGYFSDFAVFYFVFGFDNLLSLRTLLAFIGLIFSPSNLDTNRFGLRLRVNLFEYDRVG